MLLSLSVYSSLHSIFPSAPRDQSERRVKGFSVSRWCTISHLILSGLFPLFSPYSTQVARALSNNWLFFFFLSLFEGKEFLKTQLQVLPSQMAEFVFGQVQIEREGVWEKIKDRKRETLSMILLNRHRWSLRADCGFKTQRLTGWRRLHGEIRQGDEEICLASQEGEENQTASMSYQTSLGRLLH